MPNVLCVEGGCHAELPHGERRRHERSRIIINLFFDGTDATGVAGTRDIGAGGLYMNTQAALPEGAKLTLRIPFGKERLVAEAVVIYSNPGRGVGVRFDGLTAEARAALENIGAGACPDCSRRPAQHGAVP